MGNIFTPEFTGARQSEVWRLFVDQFENWPTGTKAWYSDLVTGCAAGDWVGVGDFSERLYEPVQDAIAQEVLLGLGSSVSGKSKQQTHKRKEK